MDTLCYKYPFPKYTGQQTSDNFVFFFYCSIFFCPLSFLSDCLGNGISVSLLPNGHSLSQVPLPKITVWQFSFIFKLYHYLLFIIYILIWLPVLHQRSLNVYIWGNSESRHQRRGQLQTVQKHEHVYHSRGLHGNCLCNRCQTRDEVTWACLLLMHVLHLFRPF